MRDSSFSFWQLCAVSLFLTFSSCANEVDTPSEAPIEDLFSVQVELEEETVKDLIIKRIKIDESDIGAFEIHKAHLNADGFEDGYIVMNLAPRAKKDMEQSANPARFHDAGYIGDYNFLYVWDGKTKTLGKAFKLVGNGLVPLKVTASNFMDPGYKSLSAEYRVQNSTFETFFMNINGQLLPVFSYTKVDMIGTPEMQVTTHKFQENPERIEKDILIVRGILSNYDAVEAALNLNSYDVGNIEPTDEIIYHFFFDEASRKYATNVEK